MQAPTDQLGSRAPARNTHRAKFVIKFALEVLTCKSPANLFTRKRTPHRLHRCGLSTGPRRQQTDVSIPQWRHPPAACFIRRPLRVNYLIVDDVCSALNAAAGCVATRGGPRPQGPTLSQQMQALCICRPKTVSSDSVEYRQRLLRNKTAVVATVTEKLLSATCLRKVWLAENGSIRETT